MRIIRVTVERTRVPRRVWLKAVDNQGHAEVIQNIPLEAAVGARNALIEKLTDSGLYDEVLGEPVDLSQPIPARKPNERKHDDPNHSPKRNGS